MCRMVKKEQDLAVESSQPVEHKDYSLKAGQKIQINLGVSASQSSLHFLKMIEWILFLLQKKVLQKDEESDRPKQPMIGRPSHSHSLALEPLNKGHFVHFREAVPILKS